MVILDQRGPDWQISPWTSSPQRDLWHRLAKKQKNVKETTNLLFGPKNDHTNTFISQYLLQDSATNLTSAQPQAKKWGQK